ncbi:sigma factor G inhibitor Gin [Bacillaceae bacterium W0354]
MNEQSMNQCKICEEHKSEGIYLLVSFICSDCEKEILGTSPEEERYQYYVDRLKRSYTSNLLMTLQ